MSAVDRALEWSRDTLDVYRIGKFLAAVVVGLGIGTAVSGGGVTLPAVGSVPSIALGVALLAVGAVAFTQMPSPKSGCSCSGDCNCS